MRRIALLFLAVIATAPAAAQERVADYPSRPIKLIVPYPPGALTDTLARAVAERLSPALKRPVVIENKPGAGTLLAADYVRQSAPDGYTLMMVTSTTLGISPALYKTPVIDPVRDFAPVSQLGSVDFFLIGAPAFPPRNVKEMLDLIKAHPGKYNYASVGNGSPHHLFMEVLKKDLGLNIQHVPYKGTVAALPDLMSGKVQLMFCDAVAAVPQIKAGKVVGLGTSSAKQSPLLASVPPVARTVSGFDWQAWQGVAAPAGSPRPIIAKLNAVMQKFQNTPEFKELLGRFGMEPSAPNTPDQFAEIVKSDAARWAAAVRISGATAE